MKTKERKKDPRMHCRQKKESRDPRMHTQKKPSENPAETDT
jgi:hypothetical protein